MSTEQDVRRVSVSGDFTISNAEAIRTQLQEAIESAEDIEVDLTEVAEIDSAGLQIMVAAKREAGARHRSLRFAGHSTAVLDALDLLDLSAHLGDPVVLRSGDQEGKRS
jgi:anti-sigma B factor antagonist